MDQVTARTQVEDMPNEVGPLVLAAVASVALVAGLAFAVQEKSPAASIAVAGKVTALTAALAAFGFVVLRLGRAKQGPAEARASKDSLQVGGKQVRFRFACAVATPTGFAVDVERATGTLRLNVPDRRTAEELASALSGRTDGVALGRFRLRANYYLYVATVWAWLLVYGALVVIPSLPVVGSVLTALLVLAAGIVTARAVPGQVVVLPSGVVELRPYRTRFIPAPDIEAARVADDLHLSLALRSGESVLLGELHEHPREPQPATTAPAADRLEEQVRAIL